MLEILRKSLGVGVVTTDFPATPAEHAAIARGRPEIDYAKWKDARVAGAVCPTGAISCADREGQRTVELDLAKCTFCGLCAEVDPAIQMTGLCELASAQREQLRLSARYRLNPDGTHRSVVALPYAEKINIAPPNPAKAVTSVDQIGAELKEKVHQMFGRSLQICQVDAGSCNGCEIEIHALNSPIYDVERFGIHLVASPRHADMLLVTGPVTRNMELALKKTYEATPPPRLVVAVGACGCSGGIFGENYATVGAVDKVIPVDVYIPGCPPNPHALLQGILLAVGRGK